MKTLWQYLKEADKKRMAIGHFNFAEMAVFHAMVNMAKKLKAPVIGGTSEGERQFFNSREAVVLVRRLREEEGLPIFLNADHTKNFDRVKEAVAAGYDAILFDGASLPFEENVKQTKKVVEYVKSKIPEIIVEGEIGYIGSSSLVLEKLPKGAMVEESQLTTAQEAEYFVRETKVDMLAPAVGSVHGIIKGFQPKLDAKRAGEIKRVVKVPLVLHGASGTKDGEVRKTVKEGITIVHYSTELRLAWREALQKTLAADKKELAPYRILDGAQKAVEKVIEEKMRVLGWRA